MSGFRYVRSKSGGNDVTSNKHQLAPSLTLTKGTCLNLSAGKLSVAGTNEVVTHILMEDATSTATSLVKPAVISVCDDQIFECGITPVISVTASSGSTTTAVATTSTSDNDYDGGTIFILETGDQRVIDDSQDTAGVCTFTVLEAFSRAIASGDHIKAVPFAQGDAVKLDATGTGMDTDVGDETGGKLRIEKVDLKRGIVEVSFLQA